MDCAVGIAPFSFSVECLAEPGWQEGLVGDDLSHVCSYGRVEVTCNSVGHWELVVNDCACAQEGIWEQAELSTTHEVVCGMGRKRRTCGADGFWEEERDICNITRFLSNVCYRLRFNGTRYALDRSDLVSSQDVGCFASAAWSPYLYSPNFNSSLVPIDVSPLLFVEITHRSD